MTLSRHFLLIAAVGWERYVDMIFKRWKTMDILTDTALHTMYEIRQSGGPKEYLFSQECRALAKKIHATKVSVDAKNKTAYFMMPYWVETPETPWQLAEMFPSAFDGNLYPVMDEEEFKVSTDSIVYFEKDFL